MIPSPRRPLPALAGAAVLAAAVLAAGCASPGGLGRGEPAPAVSAQPRPEHLWPAWDGRDAHSPGAEVATRQPAPEPLPDAPRVPAGGLAELDPMKVVGADRRMKPFAARGKITGPGRAGIRPAVLRDLTGDGRPELIIGADLESGRSAVAVYRAVGDRVVPVLYTSGRQVAVETLGCDLLVRTAASDGAEQAVRYRWDGVRLSVFSDEKRYGKHVPDRTEPTGGPSGPARPGSSRTPGAGR
ncbi:hypothetical protein [Streptomyces sp. NPDC089919]|uniref:FG-GAP repeat protein n=1 Tax=Streptomyces sp. NPDC089919 TaxID=3155188 RepID=UPI003440AC83